ncbi:MAG: 50S ribosomal protein L25, partial [Deltaproteobacteria bacterium]|nr:50S ribosomal protein L25 [Deltaproteobacteria bacterium]
VSALPQYLPDQIEVDVTDLVMGHSIHIADIKPPANVRLVYEDNFALASVVAPKGAEVVAGEGEAEATAEAEA